MASSGGQRTAGMSALAAVTEKEAQWERSRTVQGMSGTVRLEMEDSGLREILLSLPADIRRNLRRTLRHTGDKAIAEMHQLLSAELPGRVEKVEGSRKMRRYTGTNGKVYYRYGYEWRTSERTRGESSGEVREGIKAGLRTRVVAGKTRSGITLSTTKAKMPAGKNAMVNAWNAKRFRHPVFGSDKEHYVTQAGQPYFFHPAIQAVTQMREETLQAINDAIREASTR